MSSEHTTANSERSAFRMGDLVWCLEPKKIKMWWPAMVTYDPQLGIYFRNKTSKCSKVSYYHVQYFGITTLRGWTCARSTKRMLNPKEHSLPDIKKVSRKVRQEYEVAAKEAEEAFKLDDKSRKLKFIYDFQPSKKKSTKHSTSLKVKSKPPAPVLPIVAATASTSISSSSDLTAQVPLKQPSPSKGQLSLACEPTQAPALITEEAFDEKVAELPDLSASTHCFCPPPSIAKKVLATEVETAALAVVNIQANTFYQPPSTGSCLEALLNSYPPNAGNEVINVLHDTIHESKADTHSQLEGSLQESNFGRPRRKRKPSILATPALRAALTSTSSEAERPVARANVRIAPPLGSKRPRDSADGDNASAPSKKRHSNSHFDPIRVPVIVDKNGIIPPAQHTLTTCPITAAILTPPSSCTEESPSVDFEFDKESSTSTAQSDAAPQLGSKVETTSRSTGTKRDRQEAALCSELSVCSICDEEDTSLLQCTAQCCNSFHLDCLGLVKMPSFNFVCDDCLYESNQCFVCGKSDNTMNLKKCNKTRCSKLYHLRCIEGNKLFSFADSKKTSFSCPLHTCGRCTSIGTTTVTHNTLVQCTKCPLALHKPDCLIAGCELLGPSQMICYQHLEISNSGGQIYTHQNFNTCLECGELGDVYCCDWCSAAYHAECLDEDERPPDSGSEAWKCPSCVVHDLPTYGSLIITKFGCWRWWPGEVVEPSDVPDNIVRRKPGKCMFVMRFCGSRDFCWTYHGRSLPYIAPSEGEGGAWRKTGCRTTDVAFKRALKEATELSKSKQEASAAHQKTATNHYYRIKSNKYLVPRPQLDYNDSIPCHCTPKHPCDDSSVCINRASLSECDPKTCPVGKLCQNQRIQKSQYPKMSTFFTGGRGWGLKAKQNITEGSFVIEYVGEVLDTKMCKERLRKCHENNTTDFYMLTLSKGLVIDAGEKSNKARFINHSCDPNLETQKWIVRGETRIGLFARKDISSGTELTFDYQLDSLGNEKKRCLCGSENCSGFLGLKSKVPTQDSSQVKPKVAKLKKKKKKPTKPKPLSTPQEDEEFEHNHEDDCFICGDGGKLLMCDWKGCTKAYHLFCVGRKMTPAKDQVWNCPRHFCQVCSKTSTMFCSTCPVSYCSKHKANRFIEDSIHQGEDKLQCLERCSNTPVEGDEDSEATIDCSTDEQTFTDLDSTFQLDDYDNSSQIGEQEELTVSLTRSRYQLQGRHAVGSGEEGSSAASGGGSSQCESRDYNNRSTAESHEE